MSCSIQSDKLLIAVLIIMIMQATPLTKIVYMRQPIHFLHIFKRDTQISVFNSFKKAMLTNIAIYNLHPATWQSLSHL